MKQFGKILLFELKSYFRNKVFVGVTIFFVIVIALVMCVPHIVSLVGGDTEEEKPLMIISVGDMSKSVGETLAAAFPQYETVVVHDGLEDIKERVGAGEAQCGVALDGLTSYTYYVKAMSMYSTYAVDTAVIDEVLREIYRMNAMIGSGMTPDEAAGILDAPITSSVISLTEDKTRNFLYTYIMIFALYMVILLYGQMVASSVATEKSSRAMELLITSAKPTSMMFGKIIAACLAGLTQLVALFGSALIFYAINSSYWAENAVVSSIFNIPFSLLLYMLVFFILGFLIYAFLYGAIGSTASKLEDINTSVMPITMLFIVGFLVVVFSMASDIDNLAMKICSFVPFTSPMAMFTRLAMSVVPWYEVLISIILLVASVIGIGFLSAKIYRAGVLMYGTKPKFSDIIKTVFKA